MLASGTMACGDDASVADAGVRGATDAGQALSVTGGPCASDAECRSGLTCLEGVPDGRPWMGGYCTRDCENDLDCPLGTRCGPSWFESSDFRTVCLATCDRETALGPERGGCREGYSCYGDGVCLAGCVSDESCVARDEDPREWRLPASPGATCDVPSATCRYGATPGTEAGTSCVVDRDCDPGQGCLLRQCVERHCDVEGCSEGFQCVGFTVAHDILVSVCFPECELRGECPDTTRCVPPEADPARRATHPYCSLWAPGPADAGRVGDPCTLPTDCSDDLPFPACVRGVCSSLYCGASGGEAVACPEGSVCATLEDVGSDERTREERNDGELGFCLLDCAVDPERCPARTTCVEGRCLPG